jgi:hypothetical protein
MCWKSDVKSVPWVLRVSEGVLRGTQQCAPPAGDVLEERREERAVGTEG